MHAILGYIIAPSELIQGDIHEFDIFTLTLKFFLLILLKCIHYNGHLCAKYIT